MKKTTIFFLGAAVVTFCLALYNKKRQTPFLSLALPLLGATASRLGCSLQKAIALKGILSFTGVTLISSLCKKAV